MLNSPSAPGSKRSLGYPGDAEPWGEFVLRHLSPTTAAVLVDAAFFLRRARCIWGELAPDEAAGRLHGLALDHLRDGDGRRTARLYRVFVYDAPPARWKGHTPLAKKPIDLGRTEVARWREAFHESLRQKRKVALRLGELPDSLVTWRLRPSVIRALSRGERALASVSDADFELDLRQKGVDMRLGLDIASLAFKRQVNQIVLVAGDSDFVPAAKLARREGIDVVLDPMWATIRPELREHVDGLRSVCPRPSSRSRVRSDPGGGAP